ncbi:stage 0 DNA-binding protein [Amylolactobacillus amylotrophicus DSM 20534]|uniref:Stage 0 DNA-binding protein n=3 Tax=Amylolactobacillus TaxID=2767876 RepID=A0A0R1YQS0_9LACO|nr:MULTISPECIES: nucleoid occlusion protein [Amylolactobacillus]APT18645.1 nucleoid occlusion protein [Amylolactobacillus amylophilus DSM 20533 = JCM 1125]KRK37792.1 stage 0 DNA-binding protein [Amylolactobacillus amylotrophicus DSM 20534]KRM41580.1 stage 0 DNA-binding protein [Amylolactobacillus amylophilus DSM 20533 = JCM 1125]GED80810.1 nucleoid occlusion protein [Amylolactobacillus amylophilus]
MAISFFGNRHQKTSDDKKIQNIELNRIIPNKFQPRKNFTYEAIDELAATLKEHGLLQPIILREFKDGEYEIIAGERRFRAASQLKWETIPAIVEVMDDQKAAAFALIENLQRENLNPIDEAKAYQSLMELDKSTQTELAEAVGKSQSYVANKLRLLKLEPHVQAYLVSGEISQRHGRELLKLTPDLQETALSTIVKNGLSVAETEKLVQQLISQKNNQVKETQVADKVKKKITGKTSRDLKVPINTIKKTIKLVEDSGTKVKISENQTDQKYTITIELLKD